MRAVPLAGLFLGVGLQLTACADSDEDSPDALRGDGRADAANRRQSESAVPSPEPDSTAVTGSYRYRLGSYCGERALLGSFEVVQRDGAITSVKMLPPRESMFQPKPRDIPTLADLLAKAADARPDADVRLTVDPMGLPVLLEIDHRPHGIDDEECYEITDLKPLP